MFQSLATIVTAIISIFAAGIAAPYWLIFRAYMGWRATLFMIVMWMLSPAFFSFVNELNAQLHEIPPFSQAFFDMWWAACIPFIGYQLVTSFIVHFRGKPYGHAGRWILFMPERADFVIVLLLSVYFFFTQGEIIQGLVAFYTGYRPVWANGFFETSVLFLIAYWVLDMIASQSDGQFKWLGTGQHQRAAKL